MTNDFKYVMLFIQKNTLDEAYGFHFHYYCLMFYTNGIGHQKGLQYQHRELLYAWRDDQKRLYLTNRFNEYIWPGGEIQYFRIESDNTLTKINTLKEL